MDANRKYSDEEKAELIKNLNFEVAHRIVQFRRDLEDRLENFKMNQETLLSHIPKSVRSMTMRDFGEKYKGNVQAAVRGVQKAKFVNERGESALEKIDKSTRKRKWVASQETESDAPVHGDVSRATKSARMMPGGSPPKRAGSSTGPGTAQRARLYGGDKTPGKVRTFARVPASPSPQKARPPFNTGPGLNQRPQSRPASPTKALPPKLNGGTTRSRVPSTSTFNPVLPPKTPGYPGLRLPRRDESMLSLNGSPLANPFAGGREWPKGPDINLRDSDEDMTPLQTNAPRTLTRAKSSINIRRDPSFLPTTNGFHSRTNSQASLYDTSTQPSSTTHSRSNSELTFSSANDSQSQSRTQPDSYPSSFNHSMSQPSNNGHLHPDSTRPFSTLTRSYSVTISTKDGHLLEFDPLQTSPRALDALEGITDSAKKQARQEMGRLVQAAVEKWKIA